MKKPKPDPDRPMVGPGVVRRSRGVKSSLVLRPGGLGRVEERVSGEPEFDPNVGVAEPSPRRRVTQVTVPAGSSTLHDVVLPLTEAPVRWNCYARALRGRAWHVARRVSAKEFSVSLLSSELRVRGLGPAAADSEPGETAWRFSLSNVSVSGKARDLLARFVVVLGD